MKGSIRLIWLLVSLLTLFLFLLVYELAMDLAAGSDAGDMGRAMANYRMDYSAWVVIALLIPAAALRWVRATNAYVWHVWLSHWGAAYVAFLVHLWVAFSGYFERDVAQVFASPSALLWSGLALLLGLAWGADVVGAARRLPWPWAERARWALCPLVVAAFSGAALFLSDWWQGQALGLALVLAAGTSWWHAEGRYRR